MRTTARAGLAVSLSTLLLAGCGAGSSGSSSGGGPDEPVESVRAAISAVTGLDLTTNFNGLNQIAISIALEKLMTLDDQGQLQPALAESMEMPDPQTYVYHLRDGVEFWDGTPLTAEDVVFSLSRNLGEGSQLAGRFELMESVEAEDENTIVIRLKQPSATFIYMPAMYGYIVSKAYAEEQGDALGTSTGLTMGTGPYEPTSFRPDTGIEYVANTDYWAGDPPAATVTLSIIADSTATALAMQSGEIDMAFYPDPTQFESVPNATILSAPSADQMALSMNVTTPPFDDVHVRRAIAHATNKEGIVQAASAGAGAASQTIVPEVAWSNLLSPDEVSNLYEGLPNLDFDLDAARHELAQSAYPDGFAVTVSSGEGNSANRLALEVLKSDLEQIGIDLTIKSTPVSAWLDELYGPRDQIGMMLLGWGGSIPDPEQYAWDWLSSTNAAEGGVNAAVYSNATVDALLADQRASADPEERVALFTEILKIVGEDVPYVSLMTTDKSVAIADGFTWSGDFNALFSFTTWAMSITG